MTRQRKAEIRRIAYARAARELAANIDITWSDREFPDDEEARDEFEKQLDRIVHELEAKARA
ncbi:hypothetical protein AB0D42_27825 [Streptomyces sp. NPDC048304]|uniref:hypothetical protein n=1 Tax=Streptomyces sp. NPDC048304 TaxID=3154820 RepID=UPI0033D6DD52